MRLASPKIFVLALLSAAATLAAAEGPTTRPGASDYRALADETERGLRAELSLWYPRSVDRERGGFRSNFNADWSPGPPAQRSVVFQSRMIWTAAEVTKRRPVLADEFRPYVSHGVKFLRDVLWDAERGGFYWVVDPDNKPYDDDRASKHSYGNAFAIYALAEAHRATADPEALDLAKRAFLWLDERAHDDINGGYFDALDRDGRPRKSGTGGRVVDQIGGPYGTKSMNAHIHLMEAFNVLHQLWRDSRLEARLREVFLIVRDRIAVEPGCLNQYFTPDWPALPNADSYGHDVETGYLLLEAADGLDLGHDPKTVAVARSLVDHALAHGWDAQHGGFYDEGPAVHSAKDLSRVHTRKVWWVQAEGLNALLLFHERFGHETDVYWNAAVAQWNFIARHQVDPAHGGWFAEVDRDGTAKPDQLKGQNWKASYHTGRSLMLSGERLEKLAGAAALGRGG